MARPAAPTNGLHVVCAIGAVLVGVFLLLGAWGHFQAVRPLVAEAIATNGSGLPLLVPGVILAATGVVNLALCPFLWSGRPWAVQTAVLVTVLALAYLVYLLVRGVPNHPVGAFTAVVASYLVLLVAIRAGLAWPARNGEHDS